MHILTEAPSYESQYPDINQYNVFSISKLSFDPQEQIDWKKGWRSKSHIWANIRMAVGRIIHKHIQKGLAKSNEPNEFWIFEHEVRLSLPYDWKTKPYKEIILMGHIDALNIIENEILEIKTSANSDAISEYHKIQAATYWFILKTHFAIDCRVVIVKINSDVILYELTNEDKVKYSAELINRAYQTAKELDK